MARRMPTPRAAAGAMPPPDGRAALETDIDDDASIPDLVDDTDASDDAHDTRAPELRRPRTHPRPAPRAHGAMARSAAGELRARAALSVGNTLAAPVVVLQATSDEDADDDADAAVGRAVSREHFGAGGMLARLPADASAELVAARFAAAAAVASARAAARASARHVGALHRPPRAARAPPSPHAGPVRTLWRQATLVPRGGLATRHAPSDDMEDGDGDGDGDGRDGDEPCPRLVSLSSDESVSDASDASFSPFFSPTAAAAATAAATAAAATAARPARAAAAGSGGRRARGRYRTTAIVPNLEPLPASSNGDNGGGGESGGGGGSGGGDGGSVGRARGRARGRRLPAAASSARSDDSPPRLVWCDSGSDSGSDSRSDSRSDSGSDAVDAGANERSFGAPRAATSSAALIAAIEFVAFASAHASEQASDSESDSVPWLYDPSDMSDMSDDGGDAAGWPREHAAGGMQHGGGQRAGAAGPRRGGYDGSSIAYWHWQHGASGVFASMGVPALLPGIADVVLADGSRLAALLGPARASVAAIAALERIAPPLGHGARHDGDGDGRRGGGDGGGGGGGGRDDDGDGDGDGDAPCCVICLDTYMQLNLQALIASPALPHARSGADAGAVGAGAGAGVRAGARQPPAQTLATFVESSMAASMPTSMPTSMAASMAASGHERSALAAFRAQAARHRVSPIGSSGHADDHSQPVPPGSHTRRASPPGRGAASARARARAAADGTSDMSARPLTSIVGGAMAASARLPGTGGVTGAPARLGGSGAVRRPRAWLRPPTPAASGTLGSRAASPMPARHPGA
ncbi:hypothetical protein KFE25_011248 [Diacronema lutheri]|uniref:Uncharacterized protein n=1 Tax=Diacronema lutheri TaxID=2081491 RepID=A0A8J6C9Q5_DIALT|nr:hypothetical protein KFE25_011248 [Diacronema lutheri]